MPYKPKHSNKMRKHTKYHSNKVAGVDNQSALSRRFKQGPSYNVKPEPFPRVLKTRMKYARNGSLSQSIQNTSIRDTYRVNSLYDPFQSGVGATVVGHSNMAAIYSRYLITGCKIMIRFNNPSGDGMRVGVRLRVKAQSDTTSSTLQTLAEQPLTYISGLNNTGSQVKNMSFFVRPWTLMGLSKLEYMANTSSYSSAISSTPTKDEAWFDVFGVDPQNSSTNVSYTIRIIYYVSLYERKPLTSSVF